MTKRLLLFCLPAFAALFSGNGLVAQAKPKVNPPAGANTKHTPVHSFIGSVKEKATITADEGRQLVKQPLKVTDDKNNSYTISSYQFAYKRIGVTEDETTGTTSPQSDVAADRFTTTPLPEVWQKNIAEGLHSGEELYFFDIIVLDKQNRRFFAPEIKVTIR